MRKPYVAPETHGESGIGNCVLPCSGKTPAGKGNIFYPQNSGRAPGRREQATIVATGPLTNIALLLRIFPEVKEKYRKLFLWEVPCPGAMLQTRQNLTFLQIPEAAYMVLHEGVPLLLCAVWM